MRRGFITALRWFRTETPGGFQGRPLLCLKSSPKRNLAAVGIFSACHGQQTLRLRAVTAECGSKTRGLFLVNQSRAAVVHEE